ncbi:MAG: AI-2E family transporter [Pyrinomonadaceae bacterium]
MTLRKTADIVIIIAAAVTFLYTAKALLIPFVVAVLIWYIINALSHWLSGFSVVKRFLPAWTHVFVSALVILAAISITTNLIIENAKGMVEAGPVYQKHIVDIIEKLDVALPVDLKVAQSLANSKSFDDFTRILDQQNLTLTGIVERVLNTVSGLAGNAFLIIIYLVFLFFEQAHFNKKANGLFSEGPQRSKFFEIMAHINEAIRAYFKVKITVSILTAALSFILMKFVGLNFAFFWAFLIFVLNFIPNIGSLIATLFPSALALVQFENPLAPFLVILIGVGAIQVVVGNLIEPRMMGSSLNVSSLVVILALSLWGALWGITGMILCVPVTVILMIVCAQFESTKPFAVLLSENGELLTNLQVIHEANDPNASLASSGPEASIEETEAEEPSASMEVESEDDSASE